MILVGHANRRQAPGVLQLGIERDAVGLDRQRGAVTGDQHGARELRQARLVGAAPRWALGRQCACAQIDGLRADARVDAAAAVEAALRIGVVEIVHDARDLHALVLVQLVLEHALRARAE